MSARRGPSPARQASRLAYELRHGQARKLRQAENQRQRRQREREMRAALAARAQAGPYADTDASERRRLQQEAGKRVMWNFMSRAGIHRTLSCEEQRQFQRLGKIGCLFCGFRVVGRRGKDGADPVFACSRCGEQPVCACCWRTG